MRVVTFYSFKGGVGRTQAVANVAAELCKRGQRVIIVDMDLESPGVHAYFGTENVHANAPGLLDYLDAWRTGDQPPNVEDFLVDVKSGPGSVRVMGPGRLDGSYTRRIAALSWERFYGEEDGDLVMERLREDLLRFADTVLLDSRTGMTDIGTICTFHLPDVVVALFALHRQGIDGTALVAKALAERMGEKESRLKRVVLVPSRVEEADGTLVTEWIGRARKAFEGLPPYINLVAGSDGTTFRIPSDRDVAYGEHVVVDTASEGKLAGAYRFLVGQLVGDTDDVADQWEVETQRLARLRRADEALPLARKLVARRRERAESAEGRASLARSLRMRANLLSEVGRYAEAIVTGREGVELCRTLTVGGDHLGRAALARALRDLAVDLSRLGRREEALVADREAALHYRFMVEMDPDDFEFELTGSLDNLSTSLADVGDHDGALAASEEAIAGFRRLAEKDPTSYLPYLARGLSNLSVRLAAASRMASAIGAIEESIEVLRVLYAQDPKAFGPDLATSLNNLSTCLDELGRQDEALAAIEEALVHYRALAVDQPAMYQTDLAMGLNNLGGRLAGLGRFEAALSAFEESIRCYHSLPIDLKEACQADMAGALANLALLLTSLDRPDQAHTTATEALTLLHPVHARLPEAFASVASKAVQIYLSTCAAVETPPDEALLAGLPRPPRPPE